MNEETAFRVRKLAYALGAEISGIDLAQPLQAATVRAIKQAWSEHQVLVFPNANVTLEQQVAFSRNFGELELHPLPTLRHPRVPEVFEVTNRVADGKPSESAEVGRVWHSDGAYTVQPPTGSLLCCHAIPSVGGTTWFTNMANAWDGLSATMRSTIEKLEVVNDLFGGPADLVNWRAPTQMAADRTKVPPVVQPIVRVHPETGRKALYLSEAVTHGIFGMSRDEAEPLLQFLFRHSAKPDYLYCHHWRVGDLVMWDNRCTMHLAPHDFAKNEARQMFRTTLVGGPHGRYLDNAAWHST